MILELSLVARHLLNLPKLLLPERTQLLRVRIGLAARSCSIWGSRVWKCPRGKWWILRMQIQLQISRNYEFCCKLVI